MHIKKGDMVKVLSGDDKGKIAKVVKAFPRESKIVVEGVNMVKKHERAKSENQKGQLVDRPMPIDVSKVVKADETAKATKPVKTVKTAKK